MRAVVYDRYGPAEVLRIDEVRAPRSRSADEVLVKVHASTVTRSDCGHRAADPFFSRVFTGLRRPKQRIVGIELAGVVEEIGRRVTEFAVGDEVFGLRSGANAEYVCVREQGALAHKPASLSFEEAAALPDGASIARACLAKAELRDGKRILVYGATGAIGTAGVQLAKATGAHVTAVGNTKNVELVRSLGADVVLDYTREDFTKNGERYDVVFDAVGKHSFRRCSALAEAGGVCIETDLGFMWHVPLLALATRSSAASACAADPEVLEGGRRATSSGSSRKASTGRSSTARTHSSRSSRRRATSRRARRPATSCSPSPRRRRGRRFDHAVRRDTPTADPRPQVRARARGRAPSAWRARRAAMRALVSERPPQVALLGRFLAARRHALP